MEHKKFRVFPNEIRKKISITNFWIFAKNYDTEGFVLKKLMGDSVELEVVE